MSDREERGIIERARKCPHCGAGAYIHIRYAIVYKMNRRHIGLDHYDNCAWLPVKERMIDEAALR